MSNDVVVTQVPVSSERVLSHAIPGFWLEQQLDRCETSVCRVDLLLPAHSPRSSGEVEEHVQVLAESMSPLPPIIVHRRTMRVIDGMHRLRAAMLRGLSEIDVRWYDGDEQDAFAVSVYANVAHGLPLSLADRREATARIIESHPEWSDRMIASIVNLAPSTVASIRTRDTCQELSEQVRVGRDGRTRPVSTAAGRRLAGELLRAKPDLPLREIAKSTGLAPSTVLDVRRRLSEGLDPVPSRQSRTVARSKSQDQRSKAEFSSNHSLGYTSTLRSLAKDPSLRYSDIGRTLLLWLQVGPLDEAKRTSVIDQLPPHSLNMITALARGQLAAWQAFVTELDNATTSPQRPSIRTQK